MIGTLLKAGLGLLGGVFGSGRENTLDRTLGRFLTNKDDELNAEAKIRAGAYSLVRKQRALTWFESFANGVNSLITPLLTLMIIGFLGYIYFLAFTDPAALTLILKAMALIPQELWALQGIVIAFWFGKRYVDKKRDLDIDKHALSEFNSALDKYNERKSAEKSAVAAQAIKNKPRRRKPKPKIIPKGEEY